MQSIPSLESWIANLSAGEREKMENLAANAITRARASLMVDPATTIIGHLSNKLTPVARWGIGTMATDGTRLFYDPAVLSPNPIIRHFSPAECKFVVAHEVCHCALKHPWRFEGKDHDIANEATDYIVNAHLSRDGYSVPAGALLDTDRFPAGMSSEQAYRILYREQANKPKDDPGDDPGKSGGGNSGGEGKSGKLEPKPSIVLPAPSPDSGDEPGDESGSEPGDDMTPLDWDHAISQATIQAGAAGADSSGSTSRALKESMGARLNPAELLAEYLTAIKPSDWTWTNPDRRLYPILLPGIEYDGYPAIGIALDTSGSIGQSVIDRSQSEIRNLIETLEPECTTVAYSDSDVRKVERFNPGERIEFHPAGGGGTRFQPAIDYLAKDDPQPAVILYLSDDLWNSDELTDPGIPVIWISSVDKKMPFGKTIVW